MVKRIQLIKMSLYCFIPHSYVRMHQKLKIDPNSYKCLLLTEFTAFVI